MEDKKKFVILTFFFDHRKEEEFLAENRHILHHLIDLRQNHVEEFNMFLILLIVNFSSRTFFSSNDLIFLRRI